MLRLYCKKRMTTLMKSSFYSVSTSFRAFST